MYVNYVDEVNSFIESWADKDLSPTDRVVWFAIFHVMNRQSNGSEWSDGFIPIKNERLLIYAGIRLDALISARNRLKQMGLIDFISGNRNKSAPMYRICFSGFCSEKTSKTASKTASKNPNQYINLNQNENINKEAPLRGCEETPKRFRPPTPEEVADYCREKGYRIDPERFCDFYASKGWKVGNTPMKDWKATVRNWAKTERERGGAGNAGSRRIVAAQDYAQRDFTEFQRQLEAEREKEMQVFREGSG